MNNITALHNKAMDLLDASSLSRRKGDLEAAEQQLRQAYILEAEAADDLLNRIDAEPSRSVLYRSAATLAIRCNLFQEAERLIHKALAGQPPRDLEQELQELLEEVSFGRHLELRGVELSNVEVQVVLEGSEIGPGIAPTSEVIGRVESTNLLLFRTAERLADREYREAGPPTEGIRDIAQAFISIPRAASYAFSLRVGKRTQMSFVDPSEGLVDELLDCLNFIEMKKVEELRARIPNAAYYNNFVALAQGLLPDGDRVRTVGFTISRPSGVRQLALRQTATTLRDEFVPVISATTNRKVSGKEKPIEVTGQLRLADSVHEVNRIQVVPTTGKATTIYVPEGLMADIVKPLWDEWVTVDGLKMGRQITLLKIQRAQR